MGEPLSDLDDVYGMAADVLRCIDARLQRFRLQLDPACREALCTALEGVLQLAEVEFLDNEGTLLDPNEQHRQEVG